MDTIRLKAYGKINLGLDVIGKREDGYHEVNMIMQTVNIFDRIEINKTKNPEIKLNTNLYYIPTNENNLVYKAAQLLIDEFLIDGGVKINLRKYIPVSAGMAGGSSDAAATLYGMNIIYNLGLTLEELMERGVKLGADVPYCLIRGTALAQGIGEKLTRLPAMMNCYIVIVKPGFSVSTKHVYENLKLDEIKNHPDIEGIISAITNKDLHSLSSKLENVLEYVTIKEFPVIQELKNLLNNNGAMNSLMSGSGPTVFGLFDNLKKAKKALKAVKESKLAKQYFLTDLFNVN